MDVRLLERDSVSLFPQMAFSFEGIDRSLKLNAAEQLAREQARAAAPKKPLPPLPARVWFDFFRLSRLNNNSIFNLQVK